MCRSQVQDTLASISGCMLSLNLAVNWVLVVKLDFKCDKEKKQLPYLIIL